MDLLRQEIQSKKEPKGKKIVLSLLIISIVLLIVLILIVAMLKDNNSNVTLGLTVNGQEVEIIDNMLIEGTDGKGYISIQNIAKLIGDNYIEGGYLHDKDNKNKCYIENSNQIIEYEVDSKSIRKVNLNSKIEDEEYKLKNNIIINNDNKYIALEDLNIGCNVVYSFSEEEYKIKLYTAETLVEIYNEALEENLNVSNSLNNQKAMLYNMLVVSNIKENKMGVIDTDNNLLISYIYSTIEYNEYLENFIVSDKNKYGVISKEGRKIIEPKYQEIEIISYSPVLYKVKLNNEYGVLDKTGTTKVNIGYDKIGFNEQSNTIEPVCIIRNVINNHDGIVVCKDNKYGIVDLENGKMIIECEVDKIYSKVYDKEENKYYVEIKETEIDLQEYIDYVNTTTVITN